jgi:hypothetical protein
MKYKIFQICFEQSQIPKVDPLLTPFDNTKNEHPELREFHSFNRIIDEGFADDLDAWGVFGPRWQDKMRHSSQVIVDAIKDNPEADVWIFNHARVQDAFMYNVWEQGEYFHKGIRNVTGTALHNGGYDTTALEVVMTDATCYCSYFIARKQFWLDYIAFVKDVKIHLEALTGHEAEIYHGSANYSRDPNLNMFPFIVERLFSTYLHMFRKYKIYSREYDYSVYKDQVNDFYRIIESMNELKRLTLTQDSPDLFQHWNILRMYFVKTHPQLLNLD